MVAALPRLRDAAFVVIPLAVDLASKFVAFWSLPMGQPIQRDAVLQFVLRLNPTGLGSWAQRILAGQRPQMLLVSAAVFGGLTVALIVVKHTRLALVGKVIVCVAAALGPALVMGPLMFLSAAWSVRAVLIVLGLSRVALLLTIWVLLAPSLWKDAVGLISATAIGNLASLLLPPFAIVNFVYSQPMHRFLGFGVFSVADLVYLTGLGLLLVAAGRAFLRLLLPSRMQGAQGGPDGQGE